MSRLTWRRQPNETGLAKVCQSDRDAELRFNGETLANVSTTQGGGYYYYGCGRNSLCLNIHFYCEESAKKACKEWVISSPEFKLKQLNKGNR